MQCLSQPQLYEGSNSSSAMLLDMIVNKINMELVEAYQSKERYTVINNLYSPQQYVGRNSS